mmetsp:Transcript_28521/g.51537  ORF Transcript_28521/g.51537 Transcript_28521/m.51537 type:complete len:454 (+) Transcript_28521:64-1425(+)
MPTPEAKRFLSLSPFPSHQRAMVIVHLPSKQGGRSHIHRPVRKKRVLFSKHREIISLVVVAGFFVQLYIQQAWLLGNDEIYIELTPAKGLPKKLSPCPSINVEPLKEGLVCIEKCMPSANNTLQGLGLDPYERVNISMPEKVIRIPVTEYGKYRVHFPEEDLYLNLTGRLANEIKLALKEADENGKGSIIDKAYIHPRPITERLLRRIVAKLLRAGVLDPSKNIVNTGSWIGDNALPWALMMENLRPENPGKVIAIDPSEIFVQDMIDLANVNGIGNLCAQIGILSSNMTRVAFIGESTEHIKVQTEEHINQSGRRRSRYQARGTWTNAVPLDSLNLQKSVSLLHLDVEGHEGELLEGARATIESSRPIIITEGYNIWPIPNNENDKHVLAVMNELHYTSAFEISEHVGVNGKARNRIWWPDEKTKDAAMAIIGKDLKHQNIPWIATDLPDLE